MTHKSKLPILLTSLGIFSGIWIGLIKIMNYLIHKESIIINSLDRSFAFVILIFSSFVFFLNLLIINAIFYETSLKSLKEINKTKLRLKIKDNYNKIMLYWPIIIFLLIPIIFSVLGNEIFGEINSILTIIISLSIFGFSFFILIKPYLKKKYKKSSVKSLKIEWRSSFLKALFISLYIIMVIIFTSGVDITLDKERYSINDNVIIEIEPYGIIQPQIQSVYYSNEQYLIYNGTNEPFKASRRIIQIPFELLTDKNYNSHITVIITYLKIKEKNVILSGISKVIPVYTPLK